MTDFKAVSHSRPAAPALSSDPSGSSGAEDTKGSAVAESEDVSVDMASASPTTVEQDSDPRSSDMRSILGSASEASTLGSEQIARQTSGEACRVGPEGSGASGEALTVRPSSLPKDYEFNDDDFETLALCWEAKAMDLELRVERLSEALEFYSDSDNAKDGGKVARDAINEWGDADVLEEE